MSPLAWRILMIFIDHAKQRNKNEAWYEGYLGHITGWDMNLILDGLDIDDNAQINGVSVKYPHNDCQRAMKELIDAGLIREMPNLGERFELVVKETKQEQPKPVQPAEPTIAEYWTYPPQVQGKIREKVDLDEQLSDL